MESNDPELFYSTTYNKIKKAFDEYQESLIVRKNDDEDDGGFWSEPHYKDFYLDTIPNTVGVCSLLFRHIV